VISGRAPADHRFVILSEALLEQDGRTSFESIPAGPGMTLPETFEALAAHGISFRQHPAAQ